MAEVGCMMSVVTDDEQMGSMKRNIGESEQEEHYRDGPERTLNASTTGSTFDIITRSQALPNPPPR